MMTYVLNIILYFCNFTLTQKKAGFGAADKSSHLLTDRTRHCYFKQTCFICFSLARVHFSVSF